MAGYMEDDERLVEVMDRACCMGWPSWKGYSKALAVAICCIVYGPINVPPLNLILTIILTECDNAVGLFLFKICYCAAHMGIKSPSALLHMVHLNNNNIQEHDPSAWSYMELHV